MEEEIRKAAVDAVGTISGKLGLSLSANELEFAATAIIGLLGQLNDNRRRKSAEAGIEAASKITTADQAEQAEKDRT